MEYDVEKWLKERGYKTTTDGTGLSVTDKTGKAYRLDTAAFTQSGTGYKGSSDAIRTALGGSGATGPTGYTPLRNTLVAQGNTVGYDAAADAPLVDGQMLNKNDSRLVKVGDDYWIEDGYAKSLAPKEYENPYKEQTNSLLTELTDMQFSYDPTSDKALEAAQEQAMLQAKQSANARGLLGGSTAEIMRQRAAQELVPAYEQLAYSRFLSDRESKLETLSLLDMLADNAFNEYKGMAGLDVEKRQLALDAQSQADEREKMEREEQLARDQLAQKTAVDRFAGQLDKVLAMGIVDDEAAEVLGLAPGTLTLNERKLIATLQERVDALLAEEREWEREKELLKLQADEKIRVANSTR